MLCCKVSGGGYGHSTGIRRTQVEAVFAGCMVAMQIAPDGTRRALTHNGHTWTATPPGASTQNWSLRYMRLARPADRTHRMPQGVR